MHRCACEGCNKQIPSEQLMCRVHWYMVSKPTRDAVWTAYRGYLSGKVSINELRVAQYKACEEVEGRMSGGAR